VKKPPKKGSRLTAAELPLVIYSTLPKLPGEEISLQEWATMVNREWMKKKGYISAGARLAVAKRVVPHGQWGQLFKKDPQAVARPLLMSDRTAERLIRLARHPTLKELVANPSHGSNLPPSWRTLAELASLHPKVLEWLLAEGHLHAKTTRKQVEWWVAQVRSMGNKPSDST